MKILLDLRYKHVSSTNFKIKHQPTARYHLVYKLFASETLATDWKCPTKVRKSLAVQPKGFAPFLFLCGLDRLGQLAWPFCQLTIGSWQDQHPPTHCLLPVSSDRATGPKVGARVKWQSIDNFCLVIATLCHRTDGSFWFARSPNGKIMSGNLMSKQTESRWTF